MYDAIGHWDPWLGFNCAAGDRLWEVQGISANYTWTKQAEVSWEAARCSPISF